MWSLRETQRVSHSLNHVLKMFLKWSYLFDSEVKPADIVGALWEL